MCLQEGLLWAEVSGVAGPAVDTIGDHHFYRVFSLYSHHLFHGCVRSGLPVSYPDRNDSVYCLIVKEGAGTLIAILRRGKATPSLLGREGLGSRLLEPDSGTRKGLETRLSPTHLQVAFHHQIITVNPM